MIGSGLAREQSLSPFAWVALVLVGAAFGLGLFFNGMHIPLLSASGVLLVGFLALALAPGIRAGWLVPRSPAAAWLVVWWVFLAFSLAWSTVVYTSSLYYWWLSAFPLTFFGLVLAPSPPAWTRAGVVGLTTGAVILAVWALVQFFALPDLFHYRAHHPLLNANNLAGLLGLLLLPVVARYLGAGKGQEGLYLAIALVLFAGVVSTQSRGALVGLGVGLAVLLAGSRRAGGLNPRRLAALGGIGLAIFLVMDWWTGASLSHRVETLGSVGSESGLMTRMAVWKGAWAIVQDYPWLGTGLGTFFLYYPRYRLPEDSSTGGFYAHMDPLQFWTELGIGGPILFYALLTAILIQTVRAVRAVAPDSPERLAILGPFAGLLAVAVHTHITFHLYILPILIATGVVLAAWQLSCERALGRARVRISLPEQAHPRVWRWLLAGVVVLVMMNLGSAGMADRFIKWGRQALGDGEIPRAMDYFHYARALTPASDAAWVLGAEIRGAALSRSDLGLSRMERASLYREAQRMLQRARKRNPARGGLDHTRARLYLVSPEGMEPQFREKAESAWRTALSKDPGLIEARLGLADLYLARGKEERALSLLESGLKRPYPGTKPLALFLQTARLRDRSGDMEGALELARKALRRTPESQEKVRRAIRERYGVGESGGAGADREKNGVTGG